MSDSTNIPFDPPSPSPELSYYRPPPLFTIVALSHSLLVSLLCTPHFLWRPCQVRTRLTRQAPRGKLPYIDLDGVLIPDSENAYNTLVSRGVAQNLDEIVKLTPMEKAQSITLRVLVEEKWIPELVHER